MTENIPCPPPLTAPAHDKARAEFTAFSPTGKVFFTASLVYVPPVKYTIGNSHAARTPDAEASPFVDRSRQ